MQQYADIYLLQSHSTCFGCHSTHHHYSYKTYSILRRLYFKYFQQSCFKKMCFWFHIMLKTALKMAMLRPKHLAGTLYNNK